MKFADVPGHQEFKQKLIHDSKHHRIPHAMMFLGKEGSAGLALAWAFAQYLHCENKSENDSCGVCPSCIKTSKVIHPDLHLSFPTVSTGSGKPVSNDFIVQWREAMLANPYISYIQWIRQIAQENKQGNITVAECHSIIQKLALQSFESEYKILIMWLPEYLGQAGNVLLKLIEEPPEKTIFMLVSNDYNKIIGTIRSRTQLFKIPSYNTDEVQAYLQEKNIDAEMASHIAYIAEGDLNLALELASGEALDYTAEFRTWMQSCAAARVPELMNWSDQIGATGRTSIINFLQQALRTLRECLATNNIPNYSIKLSFKHHEFVQKFSQYVDFHKIESIYNRINEAIYHIQRNANAKIILFNLSLKIVEDLKTKKAV